MPAQRVADILAAAGVPSAPSDELLGAVVRLEASRVADALAALLAEGFDFFLDLFGTDTGEAIELTYHVRALAALDDVFLKVVVPYDGEAPSVWRSYPAVLHAEREAAELLGVSFPGHPNPKRLLTTEGCDPFLRKSVPVRTAEEVRLPRE
jgi:NADH:ubiquinone oxidoreductase subunit C